MTEKEGRREWKAASNLQKGDNLITENGESVCVEEVRVEKLAEKVKLYNLEVEDLHVYYVAGVMVHNICGSDDLTDAQKSRINALENTIEHNLKDTDFSGTLRDLQGNPVPNPLGGYYDHLTEMKQSYVSLNKIKRGLEGSLKNPNLTNRSRSILQKSLDKANLYILKIEKLFEPFGGI